MSKEEKITGLEFLKDIPKTNDLVSAYGSVNLEQLNNVVKRLKQIPNYDELLKENNNLQQENKQLKVKSEVLEENNELLIQQKSQMYEDLDIAYRRIDKAIEYIKNHSNKCMFELRTEELEELLKILGDKE